MTYMVDQIQEKTSDKDVDRRKKLKTSEKSIGKDLKVMKIVRRNFTYTEHTNRH